MILFDHCGYEIREPRSEAAEILQNVYINKNFMEHFLQKETLVKWVQLYDQFGRVVGMTSGKIVKWRRFNEVVSGESY